MTGPRGSAAVTGLALAALAGRAFAGDVGIDARHGWSERFVLATGDHFDGFRDAFLLEGHAIRPLFSFGERDLEGLGAIVLLQPYAQNAAPYSEDDAAAIRAFVARGGGLLALGEAGSGGDELVPNWNALLAPFGTALAASASEPSGLSVGSLAPHAITDGVASIEVDYHRRLVAIEPPSVDLSLGSPREDTLAAAGGRGLEGRAVILGDSSLFMDEDARGDRSLSSGGNAAFLRNVVSWILEPPYVRALAGNVGAAAGGPVDVLFVNDGAGGRDRRVELLAHEPITIFVAPPFGSTAEAPFALYAFLGEPRADTLTELPHGIGHAGRAMPIAGLDPGLRATWNNWGHERRLGIPRRPSAPAPSIVHSEREGAGRPVRVFLQGLIRDPLSPSGRVAVTNGVTIAVE